jgi:hypothetical protein
MACVCSDGAAGSSARCDEVVPHAQAARTSVVTAAIKGILNRAVVLRVFISITFR